MLGNHIRCWPNIRPAQDQLLVLGSRHIFSLLGTVRCVSVVVLICAEVAPEVCLHLVRINSPQHPSKLLCKTKRQYILTWKVSRYCPLALHCRTAVSVTCRDVTTHLLCACAWQSTHPGCNRVSLVLDYTLHVIRFPYVEYRPPHRSDHLTWAVTSTSTSDEILLHSFVLEAGAEVEHGTLTHHRQQGAWKQSHSLYHV